MNYCGGGEAFLINGGTITFLKPAGTTPTDREQLEKGSRILFCVKKVTKQLERPENHEKEVLFVQEQSVMQRPATVSLNHEH